MMEHMPRLMKDRLDIPVCEVSLFSLAGVGEVTIEIRDRKLHRMREGATSYTLVHPRTATFLVSRGEVRVESAEERAGSVKDAEESHTRVPHRCTRILLNTDPVEPLEERKEPGKNLPLRKVRAELFVRNRIPIEAQSLRHKCNIPRLKLFNPECGAGKRFQLGILLSRSRQTLCGDSFKKQEHLVRRRRHLVVEREYGEILKPKELRLSPTKREDRSNQRTVIEYRVRTKF